MDGRQVRQETVETTKSRLSTDSLLPQNYLSRCKEPVFKKLSRRVLSDSAKYRQAMMHETIPKISSGKLTIPRSVDGQDLLLRAAPVNGHQKVFVAEKAPS